MQGGLIRHGWKHGQLHSTALTLALVLVLEVEVLVLVLVMAMEEGVVAVAGIPVDGEQGKEVEVVLVATVVGGVSVILCQGQGTRSSLGCSAHSQHLPYPQCNGKLKGMRLVLVLVRVLMLMLMLMLMLISAFHRLAASLPSCWQGTRLLLRPPPRPSNMRCQKARVTCQQQARVMRVKLKTNATPPFRI
jgi:hypothetical protein